MGEVPQNMAAIVERHLVGKITPGMHITAIGIYSIYQVQLCCLSPFLQRLWATLHRQQALSTQHACFRLNSATTTSNMLQQVSWSLVHAC